MKVAAGAAERGPKVLIAGACGLVGRVEEILARRVYGTYHAGQIV